MAIFVVYSNNMIVLGTFSTCQRALDFIKRFESVHETHLYISVNVLDQEFGL